MNLDLPVTRQGSVRLPSGRTCRVDQSADGSFRVEFDTASDRLPDVRSWTDADGSIHIGMSSGGAEPTEVRLPYGSGFKIVALSVAVTGQK